MNVVNQNRSIDIGNTGNEIKVVKLIYIFAVLFTIYKFQMKVHEYDDFTGYTDVYQFTSL